MPHHMFFLRPAVPEKRIEIPDYLLDYFDFEAFGESYRYDGNIEEYSEGLIEIGR